MAEAETTQSDTAGRHPEVLVANEPMFVEIDGVPRKFSPETRIQSDHPWFYGPLKGLRHKFHSAGEPLTYTIEQATANPGTRRGTPKVQRPRGAKGPDA